MCEQSKRSQIAQQIYYHRNLFITKSGENEWELRIQPNDVLKILYHIDGFVQERCNSIANALELRLPLHNPSI